MILRMASAVIGIAGLLTTSGERPNGIKIKGPMAIGFYKGISEADLDAMVAYFRTLPPK